MQSVVQMHIVDTRTSMAAMTQQQYGCCVFSYFQFISADATAQVPTLLH
jgi:hypothetical protein